MAATPTASSTSSRRRRTGAERSSSRATASGSTASTLQNRHLRAELSADGSLLSLVERATGREALAAPGNRLELYEDRPVAWDAWDIDPAHLETREDCPPASSWSVVTDSALRAEIAFERELGESSRLRQVVRLDAGSRRLEFRTEVDWHESHRLLKVCFPLAVRAPRATYEMPFGYAERPTHFSTSRDAAQYEVPGHRFADLSEHGFGAAVLTDSKYGYSCHGSELRVSLLRAPKSPDPDADMGRHEFAYALLPHAGGWREACVLAEAIRFNAPLRWRPGTSQLPSFAALDDPNLVLDTIKRAEDSDALRPSPLRGPRGARHGAALARGALRGGAPCEPARRSRYAARGRGSAIVVPYEPHEILTILVSTCSGRSARTCRSGGQVELAASYMSLFCPGRHVFVPPLDSDPSPEPPTTVPPVPPPELEELRCRLHRDERRMAQAARAPDPRPCTSRSSCRASASSSHPA